MLRRIVILGKCRTHEDAKAVEAVAAYVSEMQPDEVVCFEQSNALLVALRAVYEGPVGVHGHKDDDRFETTALPLRYEIAPGWISTLGLPGGVSLSHIPGNTALNAAKKFGKSVVMGHTHRLGVLSHSTGYGGKVSQKLTGMEVGHLTHRKLFPRDENAQQGFGVLTVEGQHVNPVIIRN